MFANEETARSIDRTKDLFAPFAIRRAVEIRQCQWILCGHDSRRRRRGKIDERFRARIEFRGRIPRIERTRTKKIWSTHRSMTFDRHRSRRRSTSHRRVKTNIDIFSLIHRHTLDDDVNRLHRSRLSFSLSFFSLQQSAPLYSFKSTIASFPPSIDLHRVPVRCPLEMRLFR